MVELTQNQREIVHLLWAWYKQANGSDHITLGGYAGTGKTTLISVFRKVLEQKNPDINVAFCTYTGKAAQVLKTKLVESKTVHGKDYIGTIHSLIYSPIENVKGEIVGWEKREKIYNTDLIIVDEASMVDGNIWADLKSYGLPIIAVGDHGQLAPIEGSFNLMQEPQLKLTEIHRQAQDNPIIKLSIMAREKGEIPVGIYSENVRKLSFEDYDTKEFMNELLENYNTETLILTGYNNTRVRINNSIRNLLGFEDEFPQPGDRVICLRNNGKKKIYNGMIGTIERIFPDHGDWYYAEINMDGVVNRYGIPEPYTGLIYQGQFNQKEPLNFTKQRAKSVKGDLFDYGYAITVHKAQGSQAKRVILFEERFSQMDEDTWKRWLYTAITRAEEELFVFGK